MPRAPSSNTPSMPPRSAAGFRSCSGVSPSWASPSKTSTRARARWRIFSSAWCGRDRERSDEQTGIQSTWRLGDLQVRDGARIAHALAEPGDAGDHDLALLHRPRLGHRLTHDRSARRRVRRLYRAGADHALLVHSEHFQRLVRHSLPEVHRYDLRDPVRAGVLLGDRPRLRRRGGDEVDRAWPGDSGYGGAVRADQDFAPVLDDRFFGVD